MSYFKRESAKSIFQSNKNQKEYFQNYKDDEITDLFTLFNGDRVEQMQMSLYVVSIEVSLDSQA